MFTNFFPGISIANLNFLKKSFPSIGLETSAIINLLVNVFPSIFIVIFLEPKVFMYEPFAATSCCVGLVLTLSC